jgi:serine/threonine protein kinase
LTILQNLKDARVRNRIILMLAIRISRALASLHSCKIEGEGFLAHRDVKLGNFLLAGDTVPDLKIAVADLGFVGGQESVAAAGLTGAMNAREAFVLPPGTFPFRAPEQIQPVYEVLCGVLEGPEPMVEIRPFTEVDLDIGDWLESPDLRFGDSKQREKRAKIMEIDWTTGGLRAGRMARCKLSCSVELPQQVEARGSIIKAAGQHSDIFSLGAMIYFIVTGGGNPETFWSRCVALAQQTIGAEQPPEVGQEKSIFDTCQSLAIALCDDGSDLFREDLRFLKKEAQRIAEAKTPKSDSGLATDIKVLIERRDEELMDAFSDDPMRATARVLSESPTIQPLLSDLAGDRIRLPIMCVILRCMLRGKHTVSLSHLRESSHRSVRGRWKAKQRSVYQSV